MDYIEEIIEAPTDELIAAPGGSGAIRFFSVKFGAKRDASKYPYTVANEVVAAFIGRTLGLRLPTTFIHRTALGEEHVLIQWHKFVPRSSLDVAEFIRDQKHTVTGAIVFDLFVANNDRSFGPERRNIEFDDRGMLLIDQGNACFYRHRNTRKGEKIVAGIPRLDAVEKDLSAMNDLAEFKNQYFNLLDDWGLVEHWCDRLASLPAFVFENAVGQIPEAASHPTKLERERLVEFLVARPRYLIDHINQCRPAMFPNLPERRTHG